MFFGLRFKGLAIPTEEFLDEFVEMLADQIAELPFIHNWMGFAIAVS